MKHLYSAGYGLRPYPPYQISTAPAAVAGQRLPLGLAA